MARIGDVAGSRYVIVRQIGEGNMSPLGGFMGFGDMDIEESTPRSPTLTCSATVRVIDRTKP